MTDRLPLVATVVALREYAGHTTATVIKLKTSTVDKNSIRASMYWACNEYARTVDGKLACERNGGKLTWASIMDIPDEICRKHGFEILSVSSTGFCPDMDDKIWQPETKERT